jgi:3'-phosphoadenosine 5'-phosphosulfate sulfotransferase (PAPS reductase)/FAD synthetase
MTMTTAEEIEMFREVGIAVDTEVLAAIRAGAVVAFSLSGGKDSSVAAHSANRLLDMLGHPKEDRVAIHADLGRIEWKESLPMCERIAEQLGVPLMVVRHGRHDMISRWEARFAEGKRRYAALEVFNLIGPWSSASLRFCTAELKQQVISPALQKAFPGRVIISVIGIRREESPARSLAPVSKPEPRWSKRDGTTLMSWHPAAEVLLGEVFAYHERHALPLHVAYSVHGTSRLGCSYCVLQKVRDQEASSRSEDNHAVYRHLVGVEANSTFSFQPTRWLGDVSPHLISPALAAGLAVGKVRGAERQALEASLPKGLRYVKGWPLRAPTYDEAVQVVAAREIILAHHGLENTFPTPEAVIQRFEDLLAAKSKKDAAMAHLEWFDGDVLPRQPALA